MRAAASCTKPCITRERRVIAHDTGAKKKGALPTLPAGIRITRLARCPGQADHPVDIAAQAVQVAQTDHVVAAGLHQHDVEAP